MIEKIADLTGLGVLRNPMADEPLELGQSTIIYGENGRGKSLLTWLLRSLKTGNAECLRPRATLSSDVALEATIVVDGCYHRLEDFTWRPRAFDDIEIFDVEFVARNVYSGDAVEASHRQSLCQFVMGEEGVEVAEKIDNLDQESRRLTRCISETEERLERLLDEVMPLEDFLRLEYDPEIGDKIRKAEAALRIAENAAEIAAGDELSSLPEMPQPPASLLSVLSQTIHGTSSNVAQIVTDHVEQHLDECDEEWLRTGVEQMQDEHCPFCRQNTGDADLVRAIKVYFGAEYTSLRRQIEAQQSAVEQSYGGAQLWTVRELIVANEQRARFWSQYFDLPQLPTVWPLIEEAWTTVRSKLDESLARKLSKPPVAIDEKDIIAELAPVISSTSNATRQYNAAVGVVNEVVAARKAAVECTDLRTAEAELRRLRYAEKRWDSTIAELCDALTGLREEKTRVRAAKDAARTSLDTYTERFSGQYQHTLNEFIARCNVPFSLSDFKTSYHGGKPRADYAIDLFGREIRAMAKPSDKPHFGSALSEGDRRVLALSFFLARIQRDNTIRDRTIVLDDPVCSLDVRRRAIFLGAIAEIGRLCRQLIVLTHDPTVAQMCARTLGAAHVSSGRTLKTFRIEQEGNWSVIASCAPREFYELITE